MDNIRQIASSGPLAKVRVAITGGTAGLGLALVQEFLRRGARVAFVARDAQRVARVARDQRHRVQRQRDDWQDQRLPVVGGAGWPAAGRHPRQADGKHQ